MSVDQRLRWAVDSLPTNSTWVQEGNRTRDDVNPG
jgi:hypothetical protein